MARADVVYDADFYSGQSLGSERSARVILPLLFDIYRPRSIADFGCGVGTWLKAAHDFGIPQLTGYEGPWVEPEQLVFPEMTLIEAKLGQPVETRRFDLALCMEVAEHLPADEGPGLISNLCSASDVVLFSAAIPKQGGTGHLNERKQSFWADQFRKQGFDCFDPIRPQVWDDESVEYWYRQNTLVYVKRGFADIDYQKLGQTPPILDVVHPVAFEGAQKYARSSIRRFLHVCRQKVRPR